MAIASKGSNQERSNGTAAPTSFGISGDKSKVIDAQDGSAGFHPSLERSSKTLASPTEGKYPSWTPGAGEKKSHYILRVLTEGHTVTDAFLTVAAAQIGQIMLTMPNAISKTGLSAGIVVSMVTALLSLWTMYMLSALYQERKRSLLKEGTWYEIDGKRRTVTQYHDVIGYHLGRTIGIFSQICIALGLAGTGIAQVIACAGDMYYINKTYSKRTYELIFGSVLMIFAFVPTFRHFRVLNIIALFGTTFTALFILVQAGEEGIKPGAGATTPASAQFFFLGTSVQMQAMGAHGIALEMQDAMQDSSRYVAAYFGGWIYTILLTMPHSIAVNLAWPKLITKNDNVYGVLHVTPAMRLSVWLMIIHQFVAFALYVTPLLYMIEKIVRTHHARWWIRLPARLPGALVIFFLGVAFPFYGTINSLMGAISVPTTSFVLPAVAFNWYYRTEARRNASALPPYSPFNKLGWKVAFALNYFIILVYSAFTVGGIFFSIQRIVQQSYTFGIFAECYQCPVLSNGGNHYG
ncbi:g1487 [Coccomyxa elongata]